MRHLIRINVEDRLCSRARSLSADEPSPAANLPFSRKTFEKITEKLRVHRTISRTVTRETAYFSVARVVEPSQCDPSTGTYAFPSASSYHITQVFSLRKPIVLTCRMSSLWPDDLALSVTFFPESNSTLAIVYGCNERQLKQFLGRLAMASPAARSHPLLLPGIFAELERKRLSERVEDTLDRFTLGTDAVSTSADGSSGTLNMTEEQMGEYLQLCYESQSLAKEFKAVKRQLAKMVRLCDDIDDTTTHHQSVLSTMDSQTTLNNDKWEEESTNMSEIFKSRILEIMDEYDDKIDECNNVLGNMSITMQTVSNPTELQRCFTKARSCLGVEPHREA